MKSLTLPVNQTSCDGERIFAQLDMCPSISALAYKENDLRDKLTATVKYNLDYAVRREQNYQRYMIGTPSDVFLVSYNGSSWEYTICGAGRKYGSSCVSNWTYQECVNAALRHARDCFGGVVWEHAL